MFTQSDDLIEKFHSIINDWICIAIEVIEHLVDDHQFILNNIIINENATTSANSNDEIEVKQQEQFNLINITNNARKWSIENKERLLYMIVKIFSPSMPLYATYKHYLPSSQRDIGGSGGGGSNKSDNFDTISFLQSYYQMHQQDNDIPIDLIRNICYFIENHGIIAIKICFTRATPDTLPITMAHLLFNIIFNVSLRSFI